MAPAPAIRIRIRSLDSSQGLRYSTALDLTGRRAWNRGGDVDFLGTLEVGQALLAESQYGRFVDRRRQGLLQHHGGLHFFAPTRMRHAETNGLGYRGMA